METRNQKIIDAIIRKAETCCPGSLALIGVYGSAATGDTHEKSDLDLMILINDDCGYRIANTFILEDVGIGYDIYCTSWALLESDAQCNHAQLSRLLDSELVYVNDQSALVRLKELQDKAMRVLSSDERFQKARNAFSAAKEKYAECCLTDSLSDNRIHAAGVIHDLFDCVMLYHGTYFRKGVKRTFDEIGKLNLPFGMQKLVEAVIRAETIEEIQSALKVLMLAVKGVLTFSTDREMPSAANLSGTYEEIYSNWKNKMPEAAENNDLYSSFMNLASFQHMLMEIEENVMIRKLDLMRSFDPGDLQKNAEVFDSMMASFLEEYKEIGIQPKVYKNIDEFIEGYLS